MPGRGKKARDGPQTPRRDASGLAGLSRLVNRQNVDEELDLEDIERDIMGKKSSKNAKPTDLYADELATIEAELGISIGAGLGDDNSDGSEDSLSSSDRSSVGSARRRRPARGLVAGDRDIDRLLADINLGPDDSSSDESDDYSTSSSSGASSFSGSSGASSFSGSSGSSAMSETTAETESTVYDDDSVLSGAERRLGIDRRGARKSARRRARVVADPRARRRDGRRPGTREHEQSEIIRDVIAGFGGRSAPEMTSARDNDEKARMIEQISDLRAHLEEEGIDCSKIESPSVTSPKEEIRSVLDILKHKNDRNRYSSMAEEVILGVAEGLESVFDGTREVPVLGWKPDYRGFHNTVRVKTSRMRFETAQVAGNFVEALDAGPLTRILMELTPSILLYPRQNAAQRESAGLHGEFGESRAAIAKLNERSASRLDDI